MGTHRKRPHFGHSTVDNTTYAASHPEVEGLNPEDYPGFAMPDDDGSASVFDDNLDYQDVKLKIVQQEGYDAHDFNLFDDRASQLWRKPYVDGAVRELTSNDNRSSEQLRVAVEQLMLAAGNQNPDVRLTGSAAPKSGATVKVDAEIRMNRRGCAARHAGYQPRTLRPAETKNIPRTRQAQPRSLSPAHLNYSLAHARPGSQPNLVPLPGRNKNIPRTRAREANQVPLPGRNKNIPRTRQAQPRSLRPANTKTSLARPPATVARVPSTPFQSARRSPPQRLPACLHSPRFALHQEPESPSPKGRRRLEK